MVRADLMDCIDVFLRRYGPHRHKPFGGVQMVLSGDLYQLPPVVTAREKEMFSVHYNTPFFFSSKAFKQLDLEIIELEKVYRQTDLQFVELLNRIRDNSVTNQDINFLNTLYLPDFQPNREDFYISLTAMNKTADRINEERLQTLKGDWYESSALIEGDFGKEYFPTNPCLGFKTGSQIMLLNNDLKRRWVNGSIGVIQSFNEDKECIRVFLYSGNKKVSVFKHKWEIYRFFFSEEKKEIVSELAGTFSQYPFRLAWAITIHKSQGQTFDRVILDIGRGVFAGGQIYVALSRCRSLKRLVLKSPIKRYHIRSDNRIKDFLKAINSCKVILAVFEFYEFLFSFL